MEKYIILGDLHFGKSKSNPEFLKNQLSFFKNELFPYMKMNNITKIIQCGDFLDNRKNIDGFLYNELLSFLTLMRDNNITMELPLGNHDIYYKESLDVYLCSIFGNIFDVLTIYNKQTSRIINNKKVSFIPWLVQNDIIKDEHFKSDVIIGHFELSDFLQHSQHSHNNVPETSYDEHGINEVEQSAPKIHKLLSTHFKTARVYSGHFHNIQRRNNITYVGTPYQFDWSDFKERKGFWVTDFNEYEEFIENTISLKHIKLIFNSSEEFVNTHAGNLIVQGLVNDDFVIDTLRTDFREFLKKTELFKHRIKFIINHSTTSEHLIIINILKEYNTDVTITNNYLISKIIKTDFASAFLTHNLDDMHIDESECIQTPNVLIQNACIQNNLVHVLKIVQEEYSQKEIL